MDVEEFQPIEKGFLKLTLQTKGITPSERALETVPKNGVRSCVPFRVRSLGPLERCSTNAIVSKELRHAMKRLNNN